jgi:4-diphosphocytidyl-2-C-methyl-D-erythritol kinase
MTAAVRVRAPAKVNLHLSVGPLRADGYHELHTVFHAVDLFDEVIASAADGLSLAVSGAAAADVPVDAGNLAWRAAELLAAAAGVTADVRLEISKSIPVAGGMAGGSADAAAALVACAQLWGVSAERADLADLAAQLGADVAFPLLGGTAVGTGRGEVLAPAPTAAQLHWVFALADRGISTVEAYGELDWLRDADEAPTPIGSPDALVAALAAGDLSAIAEGLANDLEAAAVSLCPTLAATLETGRAAGALAGIVSGSGPTCAFLCADAVDAARIADRLRTAGVCRDAVAARGPVPGAQVV